jgi:hypothetical protein
MATSMKSAFLQTPRLGYASRNPRPFPARLSFSLHHSASPFRHHRSFRSHQARPLIDGGNHSYSEVIGNVNEMPYLTYSAAGESVPSGEVFFRNLIGRPFLRAQPDGLQNPRAFRR